MNVPLCFLAWAFYFLLDKDLSHKTVFFAAVLHSFAILFHQTAILFVLVPVLALLSMSSKSFGQRILLLGNYALTGTMLVSAAYLGVALFLGVSSLQEFITWFLGYGSSSKYWSPASPMALVLAAVGFGRALIGAHFMFGVPQLRDIFQSTFSGNSLEDEIFFTQNLSPFAIYFLVALTIITVSIILFLFVSALISLFRSRYAAPKRAVLLLIAWLLPYTLFFIAWDASNVDLWVLQVFVFWILITALMVKKNQAQEKRPYLLLTCGLGLFIVNGIGSILPAKEPTLDYNQMCVQQFEQHVNKDDFLYIGDEWPLATHLEYRSELNFDVVSLYKEHRVSELVQQMQQRIQDGQKVYFAPDVFNINSASASYYGEKYIDYSARLQSHVCGSNKIKLDRGMELIELTCIQ